jgi:hypothetical protein
VRHYLAKQVTVVEQYAVNLAGSVLAGAILEKDVRWHLVDFAIKSCEKQIREHAVKAGLTKYRSTIWSA